MASIGSQSGQAVIVARFMGLVAASPYGPRGSPLARNTICGVAGEQLHRSPRHERFKELGLFPSDGCTDWEFLRRAALDTLGLLPTPEGRAPSSTTPIAEARTADRTPSRTSLIRGFLGNKWADLLHPQPGSRRRKSVCARSMVKRVSAQTNHTTRSCVKSCS